MTYHAALQAMCNAGYAALRQANRLDHPDARQLRVMMAQIDALTDNAAPNVTPATVTA